MLWAVWIFPAVTFATGLGMLVALRIIRRVPYPQLAIPIERIKMQRAEKWTIFILLFLVAALVAVAICMYEPPAPNAQQTQK